MSKLIVVGLGLVVAFRVGVMWGIVAVAAILAVYAGSCWRYPFAYCWRCKSGRHHRGDRKVFRDCRICGGTGRRLRIGRRIFNAIAQRRQDAGRDR